MVTSEFHMPRTQATFDFVYGLAGRQLHGDPAWYRLEYRAGKRGAGCVWRWWWWHVHDYVVLSGGRAADGCVELCRSLGP